MTLLFTLDRDGRLEIGRGALDSMLGYVQDTTEKLEAGGVLLGRNILDSSDVVIDCVTVPMPGDRRSRYRFFRAAQRHQTSIDRAWRRSNGTCGCLGEWHTHPEAVPLPSPHDWRTWRRKLVEDVYDADSLYFVILGTGSLRVWQGKVRSVEFAYLGDWPLTQGEAQ